MKFTGEPLRVLDFDIECRPLSYLGSDYTTGQVTAIASAWIVDGQPKQLQCKLLTRDEDSIDVLLDWFTKRYGQADMVTGHYIRGFDLPVINGALLDRGMEPLSDKLTHDTKVHLLRRKYVSASQENLAASLGIVAPKVQMNQQLWREANKLTPAGLKLTRKRVVGDVVQHVALRERLLALGWLGAPQMWKSAGTGTPSYTP